MSYTAQSRSQRPGPRQAIVGAPAPARAFTPNAHASVSSLIATVLANIRNQFYLDQPVRNFKRDENALTKAIARFGYRCEQNNWQFSAAEIQKAILELLLQIKRTGGEIRYLPTYLQGAVDKHLGQKAEEYSALAKSRQHTGNVISTLSNLNLQPSTAIVPTDTETLALLYKDLAAKRRTKTKKPPVKEKQVSLL